MDELILPKVSTIVTNHNYGGFLQRAYESLTTQTYPNLEIVIVDDKSTDDSCARIDEICAKDSRVVALKLTENVGQTIASQLGFLASSGAYIVFVDADDQLLSQCIEAHLYAHMSSRIPVAFTTVDIVSNAAGQDINCSERGFSEHIESGKGRRRHSLRPIEEAMPRSWFAQRAPVVDMDQLHFVLPPQAEPYVWSPTSANCYRRDALNLLLHEPRLESAPGGTDVFLIRPLSALFGSLLIDAPLMRYVSHGANFYSIGAPLNRYLSFDHQHVHKYTQQLTRLAVRRLMADVAVTGPRYESADQFFESMRCLCASWGMDAGPDARDFYGEQLAENRAALVQGFGEQAVAKEIARGRRSPAGLAVRSAMDSAVTRLRALRGV